MAVEISKLIPYSRLILIASVKTKFELPFYFRLAAAFHLHKIIPARLLKQQTAVTNWFFGVKEQRGKLLLRQILHDTDPIFLKWAIDKIVNWQSTYLPKNCIHIHGTADHVFPYKLVHANILVKSGGHFMTVDKADELSQIIKNLLHLTHL